MDNQRFFLIAALALVGFLIYQAWMEDYGPRPTAPPAVSEGTPADAPGDVPAVVAPEGGAVPAAAEAPPQDTVGRETAPRIRVRTDVLDVAISLRGGTLQSARLLAYPQSKDAGAPPVELLSDEPARLFLLQSGLRAYGGAVAPDHTALYTAAEREHILAEGEDMLSVELRWERQGVRVLKRYTFRRGSYQVDLDYTVENTGGEAWRGDAYLQLKRRRHEPNGGMFTPMVYDGPAYYSGESYHKADFDEIDRLNREAFAQPFAGGWTAVVQHYFLAALIPPSDQPARYYARTLGQDQYLIGYVAPVRELAPGAETRFESRLFLGPKLQDRLAEVAPGLELAVDYGVFTIIAEPLFWILDWIHKLVGNWGWAIILLTLLIKAVFYKLSETSGRSMAKMRKVAPRMQALRERYKDDRQKLNLAMMELYKEEKINPASGCLPILVQMPVFIALYWVLLYSVELRQAPWILWINDLSAPDPYYVLPVLVGLAMFAQQQMNPPPPDPVQRKVFMFMPVLFGAFSLFMPAGLVLYWFVNTLLSAAQQWQINRVIEKKDRKRRSA